MLAVHLAGAIWKQLRMYKVSFRCNCLCERQGLAVLPTKFIMASKTSQFVCFLLLFFVVVFWPGECMQCMVKLSSHSMLSV